MRTHSRQSDSEPELKLKHTHSNEWIRKKYLPSWFQHNNESSLTRKRRLKRIKFDLKEFVKFFSIATIAIWFMSLIIFAIYLFSACSPFRRNEQTSLYGNCSINQTTSWPLKVASENFAVNGTEGSLGSDCTVVRCFAISNICLTTLMLLHQLFYVFHVVEVWDNFPWFVIEILGAFVFVLLTFALCVSLCILSSVRGTRALVILGIIQFVCGMIILLSRSSHCRSGRPPQKPSDDVDGDYSRRNQNAFHMATIHKKEPINYKKKFISTIDKQEGYFQDMFKSKLDSKMPKSQLTTTKSAVKSALKSSLKSSLKSATKSERKSFRK